MCAYITSNSVIDRSHILLFWRATNIYTRRIIVVQMLKPLIVKDALTKVYHARSQYSRRIDVTMVITPGGQ